MKISFLIPSMYGGGAEKVASKLIHELAKRFAIELILLESGERIYIDESIKRKVLTNIDGKYGGLFLKFISSLIHLLKYQFHLIKNKPDIVISFLDRANILNLLPLLGSHKRVVSIRSHLTTKLSSSSWKGRLLKSFYKKYLHRADVIVVPSYIMREDLVDSFDIAFECIVVIPNGLNFKEIDELANVKLSDDILSIVSDYNIITNVGSLYKAKRQEMIISSFNEINTKKPNSTKLFFVGEGPDLNKLLLKASNYNLRSWHSSLNKPLTIEYDVYFLGFQSNPYNIMKNSNLFVLSSEREGFPNVLAETLYLNVPIISSDCSTGPREILAHDYSFPDVTKMEIVDYGILIPHPDHRSFQDSLNCALKYSLFEAGMHINTVPRAQFFSDEKFLEGWNDLIDGLGKFNNV